METEAVKAPIAPMASGGTEITPPPNTVASIEKELADLAANEEKNIQAMNSYKKNIFKSRGEANKFLKTPEAKEKKMILWVVRKGGKMPCFMVDTPERIKAEKKSHASFKKVPKNMRGVSIALAGLGMVMGISALFMGKARKKKFLELKLKYVKDLHHGKMASGISSMPSEKIISILEELAGISYQSAEVQVAGGTDVYIRLFGVKTSGYREDLELFDIKITVFLRNNDHNKVRHCQFNVYGPSEKYKFPWITKIRRGKKLEFPYKTGFPGNKSSLMLNRLRSSIDRYGDKPNAGIRDLYAATNMPKLRKVIPEIEQYLEKLYPQLFRLEDYQDWTPRRIVKTLKEFRTLKSTLTIPEEKPLEVGVDETARVVKVLESAFEKWLTTEKWPMPKITKRQLAKLSAGKAVNMVRPPKGYYVNVLNGAKHYKLIKKKAK